MAEVEAKPSSTLHAGLGSFGRNWEFDDQGSLLQGFTIALQGRTTDSAKASAEIDSGRLGCWAVVATPVLGSS